MEVFALVALVAVGLVVALLTLKFSLWIVAFLVFPVGWILMLIDAIRRPDAEYPSKGSNEKILWIVLMLFVHISALVYLFVVYLPGRREVGADQVPPQAFPPVTLVPAASQASPAPPAAG